MEQENDIKIEKGSFITSLLFKIAPKFMTNRLLRRSGRDIKEIASLHEALSKIERIDLFKTAGNERGFIIVLDKKTALFFYQDGEGFKYDGWESGEYGSGDVTILDRSDSRKSPYNID